MVFKARNCTWDHYKSKSRKRMNRKQQKAPNLSIPSLICKFKSEASFKVKQT